MFCVPTIDRFVVNRPVSRSLIGIPSNSQATSPTSLPRMRGRPATPVDVTPAEVWMTSYSVRCPPTPAAAVSCWGYTLYTSAVWLG